MTDSTARSLPTRSFSPLSFSSLIRWARPIRSHETFCCKRFRRQASEHLRPLSFLLSIAPHLPLMRAAIIFRQGCSPLGAHLLPICVFRATGIRQLRVSMAFASPACNVNGQRKMSEQVFKESCLKRLGKPLGHDILMLGSAKCFLID